MAENSFSKAMFTRNPILLESIGRPGYRNTFAVSMNGNTLFSGQFLSPSRIDISEIADASVPEIPDADIVGVSSTPGLIVLEDSTALSRRTLKVTANGETAMEGIVCMPGGVSLQNYRVLKSLGKDIFSARFLDKRGNFLMTTRTHGWDIEIPETEISPLVFLNATADSLPLTFRVPGTEIQIQWPTLTEGLYAIDIKDLREEIYGRADFWTSVIDIYYGSTLSSRITLKETPAAKHHTILRFRNSFGVFEKVDLTGEVEINYSAKESEETDGMRFDEDSFSFV